MSSQNGSSPIKEYWLGWFGEGQLRGRYFWLKKFGGNYCLSLPTIAG